jgi:hypothetical protein
LRLGWTSGAGAVPQSLAAVGTALWGSGQQRIGFDLTQQIYTPLGTQAANPDRNDRPYAGLLLGNFSLLSDTDSTRSVLTLSLGVLGPSAGGEQVQNGFHDLFNIPTVKGWSRQIQNTPVVELFHERTWRQPVGTLAGLEVDVLPALGIGVGNLRDYVQAGASVRIGQGLQSDYGTARLRPGISGGDAFRTVRPVAWYVFAGADAQAVGYNLLLQSSPFRSGPHVTPLPVVAELQAGAAVIAHGVRLSVTYVAQTPEFHHQRGGIHQLMSLAVSVRF